MKKLLAPIAFAAAVWAYVTFFSPRTYPPGILVQRDPDQSFISNIIEPIYDGKYTIKLLAGYNIEARVLRAKRYWSGDLAKFAPYDLALGWGPMSDQGILDQLHITQGNRFYFWEYQGRPPIPQEEIISHSANVHVIPANIAVRNQVAWLRRGDLIRMKGYLVEVTAPGMSPWRSSLSRTDSGIGSCEIMWVESLDKIPYEKPKE